MSNKRDIDEIINAVKEKFPNARVWQLQVTHPHDDNGIWYFWIGESTDDEIKVENGSGDCPFYIETNRTDERRWGNSIEETVNVICEHLNVSK